MLSTETKQFCFIIGNSVTFVSKKNFALSTGVAIELNMFSQSEDEKLIVLLEDGAVVSTIVVEKSKQMESV